MKKMVWFLVALCALLSLSTSALAETVTIVGTGDGVSILKGIGAAFTAANPDVTIDIPESIGSGGGIKAVGADEFKVARVAREIKDKEKPLGLTYLPYAKVPVVFFVHPGVGVTNLTAQQVVDIYSGKVTDWQAVGGKGGNIRVVRREDGDSSLEVLQKTFPGFKAITITEKSKTALKTPEMIELVTKKEGTIGFGPLDVATANKLAVVNIDGVTPVQAGYPSVGVMAFVYKEANNTGGIKKFLEFATSASSHEIIKQAGCLPPM